MYSSGDNLLLIMYVYQVRQNQNTIIYLRTTDGLTSYTIYPLKIKEPIPPYMRSTVLENGKKTPMNPVTIKPMSPANRKGAMPEKSYYGRC